MVEVSVHMKAQETWVISTSLFFTTQYACRGRRESDIYNPYFPNNLKDDQILILQTEKPSTL